MRGTGRFPGARMRRARIVTALVVAAALGLGAGELLAKAQTPFVVHSMTARPDLVQLQAATWEWLRASVTTSTFIAGTVVGVIFAQIGRFLVRWLARAAGLATGMVRLIVHYRLIVVAAISAIYYAVAYHVIG